MQLHSSEYFIRCSFQWQVNFVSKCFMCWVPLCGHYPIYWQFHTISIGNKYKAIIIIIWWSKVKIYIRSILLSNVNISWTIIGHLVTHYNITPVYVVAPTHGAWCYHNTTPVMHYPMELGATTTPLQCIQ